MIISAPAGTISVLQSAAVLSDVVARRDLCRYGHASTGTLADFNCLSIESS